ncbi:MAG TPA: DoxX family protein [Rhizomicrobium sp.]|jgi:putative oxidoreductase|nr:DoxX family protein [Rhizomicrobium sp.]
MNTEDLGKLVLRLTLGVLLLFHGTHKILTGVGPIRDMITSHHLPDFLAYFVYLGEVVAPVLIVIGLLTRLGGILVVINMIVAVLLVHTGMLLGTSEQGGYVLELQAFYLFSALAVALLGAGRFSVGGANGTLN